jgi:tungstate transport system substrate-binding protein
MATADTPAPNPTAVYGEAGPILRLATGSPGELGLVERLAAEFSRHRPLRLHWYKAGSGAALRMLQAGLVDIVMVHAPAAESDAVDAGWAVNRRPVGGNAYYLVGPREDPAGVRGAPDALEALRRIASDRAKFVSRGDQSGTHRREVALWADAGIVPDWPGYVASGDFMAASLRRANAEGAYFLTDSSTWVALRGELPALDVVLGEDPRLVNTYHVLMSPASDRAALASAFVDFLVGAPGQRVIADFGRQRYGEPLYLDVAQLPDCH